MLSSSERMTAETGEAAEVGVVGVDLCWESLVNGAERVGVPWAVSTGFVRLMTSAWRRRGGVLRRCGRKSAG